MRNRRLIHLAAVFSVGLFDTDLSGFTNLSAASEVAASVPISKAASKAPLNAPPALPVCLPKTSSAERSEKVNAFVDAIESKVETKPQLAKREPFASAVLLVAAYMISEDTPFRKYEMECWASFEEARRALEAGQSNRAASIADRWKTCLVAHEVDIKSAEPLLNCFADWAQRPENKNK